MLESSLWPRSSFLQPCFTFALYFDRRTTRTTGCYGTEWSDAQRALYNWLLGTSPFTAAIFVFVAIALTSSRWRYLLAFPVAIGFFAVFGVAALVVAYQNAC